MLILNDDNFDISLKNKKVIVDFYANWCGPCKMILPQFEKLSSKNNEYEFCKADVDKCNKICSRFNIVKVPTFIILDDLKVIFRGDFGQLNLYLGGK